MTKQEKPKDEKDLTDFVVCPLPIEYLGGIDRKMFVTSNLEVRLKCGKKAMIGEVENRGCSREEHFGCPLVREYYGGKVKTNYTENKSKYNG